MIEETNNLPSQDSADSGRSGDRRLSTCSGSSVEDAAVDLIRSRGVVGRRKYGTSMDRRDLRPAEWAIHLQEEMADAIQYAERIKRWADLLDDARAIMVNLRDESGWECADEWIKAHDAQYLQNDRGYPTPNG